MYQNQNNMKTIFLTGLFLVIIRWSCLGQIRIQFSDWDFTAVSYDQATDTLPPSGFTPG